MSGARGGRTRWASHFRLVGDMDMRRWKQDHPMTAASDLARLMPLPGYWSRRAPSMLKIKFVCACMVSSYQGGSKKPDSVGGFGTPPPFLKWFVGGFLRVFFDANKPFPRNFFVVFFLPTHRKFLSLPPIQPLLNLSP